jgi:hypothetical protein
MGLMPSAEGPAPVFGAAPPDQQPQDLAGALALLDSILWRDGGIDQSEQGLISAWFQNTMVRAQQAQAAGAQSPGAQQGLGESSVQPRVEDANMWGGGPNAVDVPTFDD